MKTKSPPPNQLPDESVASFFSNLTRISPFFTSVGGFVSIEFSETPGGMVKGLQLIDQKNQSSILIDKNDLNLNHFPLPNGTYQHFVNGSVNGSANPNYPASIKSIIHYRAIQTGDYEFKNRKVSKRNVAS
jgi:hypothetical protein